MFTLATDTSRTFFKVPHVVVNWLAAVALGVAWWQLWATQWKVLAAITVIGGLYLAARAARQIPGRQRTLMTLYEATQRSCGHPKGSTSRPPEPRSRIRVTSWASPKRPRVGVISFGPDTAAASPQTRWKAEQDVEAALGDIKDAVVFDWDAASGAVVFELVSPDDPQVARKTTRRWVESQLATLLPTSRGQSPVRPTITWPEDAASDTPTVVDVDLGTIDTSGREFRSRVETGFDQAVRRDGCEWLYDWTPGALTITASDPDSSEAKRKRVNRKVSDVVVGTISRISNTTTAKQATVAVDKWVPDDKPLGNTPIRIVVGLGTADVSNKTLQQKFEAGLDQALENEYTDRVWLYEWAFGVQSEVVASAVPASHDLALQKRETERIRNVVRSKFRAPTTGTPVDVEVHEWTSGEGSSEQPTQQPSKVTVTFGTVDVTKPDDRAAFQDHFDSLTKANDWRYDWYPEAGRVEAMAVPPLPSFVPFPEEGSDECLRWDEEFRNGRISLGPAKGGHDTVIDLNKSPHVLVGGATGKGKSVALMLILYGALMNQDVCEIAVFDPKVTDFTWTPGYPAVNGYAPQDARTSVEEIHDGVRRCYNNMLARQNLLREHSAKNLRTLRRMAAEGKAAIAPGDIPRRLFVFFDEGAAALTPSKDPDIRQMQEQTRTWLEQIGMLGRAMEVNIIMAAQKPSADNIGTQLRSQLVNMIAVGELRPNESVQVLGSNLATRNMEGAPPGRGWFVDDAGRELLFQTMYLPEQVEPSPDDPTVSLTGVQERVAAHLEGLGYTAVSRPQEFTTVDDDGNSRTFTVTNTEWVRAPGDETTT